jgi:adenine-specific DNA methylase
VFLKNELEPKTFKIIAFSSYYLKVSQYPKIDTYSTRFQGSKKRVIDWLIHEINQELPDTKTVFDPFAGSGIVSYALAREGKDIIAADQLLSSKVAINAFIGNKSDLDINKTLDKVNSLGPVKEEKDLLSVYQGVFFLDDELQYLARASNFAKNNLSDDEQDAFLWALFQAALAKRPYNLFHRANLAIRKRNVKRSFGNKTTWDKSFPDHLKKFLKEQKKYALPEANKATVLTGDVLGMKKQVADLTYIDPPYITNKGVATPYLDFYGFLDILINPSLIQRVDENKAHKPLINNNPSKWESKKTITAAFEELLDTYKDRPIAISYRDDGFPSLNDLEAIVKNLGKNTVVKKIPIQYALSKSRAEEALIIGV